LARLAAQYVDQVVVLSIGVERAPFIAEQYGVTAVPTLLVLRDGEELTRMVGFAPEPLLRLLFEQVVTGEVTPGRLWMPTEQAFEDAVIIPLLDDLGWSYRRQVVCPPQAGKRVGPGRIDILAYDGTTAEPLTLFEAKRQIASRAALEQARVQAQGYAQALQLVSFVIAAPAGLWIYRMHDGRSRLMQAFSSLEVATHPGIVKHALQRIYTAS
jgi:hypothetical protein